MNSTKRHNPLAGMLVVVAVAAGGLALAQGVSRWAWAPKPVATESSPATPMPFPLVLPSFMSIPAHLQAPKFSNERLRVVAWFTKYDEIRHQAQMSIQEKVHAHKLIEGAFVADGEERIQAEAILSNMINRYAVAANQMAGLPSLPETAELQKEYQDYFIAGRDLFTKYLQAVKDNKHASFEEELKVGRRQLGIMDVSHKILDRKLRNRYDIASYRW